MVVPIQLAQLPPITEMGLGTIRHANGRPEISRYARADGVGRLGRDASRNTKTRMRCAYDSYLVSDTGIPRNSYLLARLLLNGLLAAPVSSRSIDQATGRDLLAHGSVGAPGGTYRGITRIRSISKCGARRLYNTVERGHVARRPIELTNQLPG